nr:MAG TPA: distal tail protein [Caudoviricetes sp.]
MDKMIINGFDTSTLHKCYVTSFGKVQTAKYRRNDSATIYGANGSYDVFDGAFESYERSFEFSLNSLIDIETIINKFKTTDNVLEFSYHPDSVFYADFIDAEYEKQGFHAWKLTIKLKMHPFRYLKQVSDIVLTGNGSVNNIGTVYSEPIVIIEGDGDVSLTIGEQTMHLSLKKKVTIDCRHKKQAIYNSEGNIKNTLRKRGTFFELKPGISGIVITGNVTKITIKGNWRYLA